jgi:hypothetical protein
MVTVQPFDDVVTSYTSRDSNQERNKIRQRLTPPSFAGIRLGNENIIGHFGEKWKRLKTREDQRKKQKVVMKMVTKI